jgi:uncharacterized protein
MRHPHAFILRKHKTILLGIGTLTLVFGFLALRVELDRNPEEMLFQGDPEYPVLQQFMNVFGYDEIVVAVYAAENLLSREPLQSLKEITAELLALDGVDRVLSLANAADVSAVDGSLRLQPLLREMPESEPDRRALERRIRENPHYRDLLLSKDSGSTLLDITLKSGLDVRQRKVLLERIEAVFAAHGSGKRFLLSGAPFGRQEMYRCVRRDTVLLFPLSLLVLVASMFLFYRRILWTLLPLGITSLCVLWAVGTMSLLHHPFNLLSVIVPTLLVVIGTSDCIHIMSRYQDCLGSGGSPESSALDTLRAMALPCLLTSMTTMAGFLSLQVSPMESIRKFGVASAVGIGYACLLTLLLLPVGLRFCTGSGPLPANPPAPSRLDALLHGIFDMASRRKISVLLASGILLSIGLFGATRLRVETDLPNFFSRDSRGVADARTIEETFGGILPVHVILDSHQPGGLKDPGLLEAIDRLCEFLRHQDGVDKVLSMTDLVKLANSRMHGNDPAFHRIPETRGEIAQLLLMMELSDSDDVLARFCDTPYAMASVGIRFRHHDFYSIQTLKDAATGYLKTHFQPFPRVTYHVTGTSVLCANTLVPLLEGLKQSFLVALGAIFLIMVTLFRSVRLGFVSMIPNVLPIAMTLGTMGILGVSLNILTAPVAAVALGLAVDDTIHFLTCFRKEFPRCRDYGEAVRTTLMRTGRPIFVTSLVLAAGFAVLLFSDFHPTRNFGMLIGLTVLYALLGDLLLLPTLLFVFKPLGRESLPASEPCPFGLTAGSEEMFQKP